jgi:hypothetical protein
MLVLSSAVAAQEMAWESSVPSDILHNDAINGLLSSLKFKGKPISNGSRIVVIGVLTGHDYDEKGSYLDLEGTLVIGLRYGLVRCHMRESEFRKLQMSSYVYQSMLPGNSRPQVAVEGTILGLDRNRNLLLNSAVIIDSRTALLPPPRTVPPPPPPHPAAKSSEATAGQLFSGQLLWLLPSPALPQAPRLAYVRNVKFPATTIIAFIDAPTWKAINKGLEELGYIAPCFTLFGVHGDDETSSRLLDDLIPAFGQDEVKKLQENLRHSDRLYVFHDAYIDGGTARCPPDYESKSSTDTVKTAH